MFLSTQEQENQRIESLSKLQKKEAPAERFRYDFKGYHNWESFCYLDIMGNVVMATQSNEDGAGTSVTNMAADLATRVCLEYGIPMDQLVWIEHYDRDDSWRAVDHRPDTFDIVEFTLRNNRFSKPDWTHVEPKVIRQLLGHLMTDWKPTKAQFMRRLGSLEKGLDALEREIDGKA